MSGDFEIVESGRFRKSLPEESGTNTEMSIPKEKGSYMSKAVADNMDSIIDIAKDMVEIKKMQVQSSAVLAKMEEDRKMLAEQTRSYVEKKRVNNEYQLDRMEQIRLMLKDFYQLNDCQKGGLSGEEFSAIIQQVIEMDGGD